jgi:hypothetical protein
MHAVRKIIVIFLFLLVSCSPIQQLPAKILPVKIINSAQTPEICLEGVSEYVYAFPGYEYDEVATVLFKEGPSNFPHANYFMKIQAKGLQNAQIVDQGETRNGDTYRFDLEYNKENNVCNIVSISTDHYIVPKSVYEQSLSIAKKDSFIGTFFHTSKKVNIIEAKWFDEKTDSVGPGLFKGPYDVFNKFEFKKPVKWIMQFQLQNSDYCDFLVFVDSYGDVFAIGPTLNRRAPSVPKDPEEFCKEFVTY